MPVFTAYEFACGHRTDGSHSKLVLRTVSLSDGRERPGPLKFTVPQTTQA
jgi:hypothetical protein